MGLVGDGVPGQFVGNPVGRCRLERKGSGSHKKMLGVADLKQSNLGECGSINSLLYVLYLRFVTGNQRPVKYQASFTSGVCFAERLSKYDQVSG